jgi:hypothetical protein
VAAEDGVVAAAREVVEETGYKPRSVEYVMTFQPIIGSADSEQQLYLARGADQVGSPDGHETGAIRWFPLEETPAMIADGQILGAATIIGVQHALLSMPRSAHWAGVLESSPHRVPAACAGKDVTDAPGRAQACR